MSIKAPQHKPHYIGFVATSIDGRISLSHHHPPEWTSKEDWTFFQSSLSRMDAVVVGRNTYNAVADRLRKRHTYVLSHRPDTLTRRGMVTFVNPATVDLPTLLKDYHNVAVLGGGSVYDFMAEHGLLNELFVTVEPLIFGRGKEMFSGGTKTIQTQLLSVRKLNKNGTLLLHYKINPGVT
ncbi:MAG: dihydrofolate reductase [bacterium]|nr:dihydrofolate reductase [bacterium]